ncbi:DUF2306 domain-containing protein [Actinocrispum wychmicini]|uniref:Putative membrane protein DUF2306 n=1 Tax=Actinocrispum wychmicini TaxID=1213861 RepID=A0A4R2J7N3_9PSEU|nr:DUF2306 domain-containing protein [Actinocrispum wychmicini]TCO53652.1 putative membrane protein DUF2306 [Actinocrispum wychmicini]
MTDQDPLAGPAQVQARRWWRRPWVVPLAFIAAFFIAFSLPPYLAFDSSKSRVPPPPGLGWYYGLLSFHVVLASIAMITCVFQIWPWFRQRHLNAHRILGRLYVFAGVLPAGICALILAVVSPLGPAAKASTLIMAPLWLTFTVVAYRMVRQKRIVEHRRWMIRSFALTMSIITNRVWGGVMTAILQPDLDTRFHGDATVMGYSISGVATWAGWVVPLLIAEWWLERGDMAKHRARAQRRKATAQPQTPATTR